MGRVEKSILQGRAQYSVEHLLIYLNVAGDELQIPDFTDHFPYPFYGYSHKTICVRYYENATGWKDHRVYFAGSFVVDGIIHVPATKEDHY